MSFIILKDYFTKNRMKVGTFFILFLKVTKANLFLRFRSMCLIFSENLTLILIFESFLQSLFEKYVTSLQKKYGAHNFKAPII